MSFAQSVEVYRWAFSRIQESDGSSLYLTDQILIKNGASRLELDEAAKDAFVIQRLEVIADEEKKKLLPQEPDPPATPKDEQAVVFEITISLEPNKVYDENLFADELRYFSANVDKPQLVLIHSAIRLDQILAVEFDNHNLRRDFVNRLASISPSERITYLQNNQFDEKGVKAFWVDRPNYLGGISKPEETTEGGGTPGEDTSAS